MTRQGASTKMTLADAADELADIGPVMEDDDEPRILMPHLLHKGSELDTLFPSMQAPEDEHLEDPVRDADDRVLQKGMEIAKGIEERMKAFGRKRHEDDGHARPPR